MKKIAATVLCLFILISGIRSQELMTLDQAVSIGLSNNYGIMMSRNSIQTAKNNASPGNAGMLPTVGVNAGYTKGLNDARVKVATGNELDNPRAESDLLTGGIGLNWTIFDGLNMFITYDKLKKIEEASELSGKIAIETTVARIISGYYDIVHLGKIRDMFEEQVEISKFRCDLAKMRFETGAGSEMEYLKSRVELNADIANLSTRKTLLENSKTTLNDLLSRDVTTGFSVIDSIPVEEVLNYDTLLLSLVNANRNLQLTDKTRQIAELDVKTTQASQWPTLTYFAGFNYYRNETEANFIQYNRYFGPTTGLTLNMKIFDGLNQKRKYKNAVLSLDSYELAVKQMENQLLAHLSRIYNEYRNQLEMIGFERENLQLAVRDMELAKESYQIGAISSLELREMQEDLLMARNRLATAQFNVKLTETELLLLSGKLIN
ncbi:MAG: TolC family protein [Bacteroidota bacterium]